MDKMKIWNVKGNMIRKSILYRIGHKFGTDNSFVSYWKKYRSYRLYQRNLAVLASKRIPKQRRRKGRRRWRSRAARVALWGNCFFFFFFFFSVGLFVSLSFYFFWTLLCMVWFLIFSFFVLYLFSKFSKLSMWLSTLTLAAKHWKYGKLFIFE